MTMIDELDVLDDLDGLDARELAELFTQLEVRRRRVEAALVKVVATVDRRRMFRADGHASTTGWCRALGRWSNAECRDRIRLARLVETCGVVDEAVSSGSIGVAQGFELGRAFANPRIGDQLVDVASVLVEHARQLTHADFAAVVATWVRLTDADGAHADAEAAHRHRDAVVIVVGDELHVRAHTGLAAGAILHDVFERFVAAEWDVDWQACRAEHGDDACPGRMRRTDAQRRADALVAIFEQAVAIPGDARRAEPLVNIVVDIHTLDELINAETTLTPPPDPRMRRCDTLEGTPVPATDVLAALWWGRVRRVVVDSANVRTEFGREQRLFTGRARDAALFGPTHCVFAGCAAPIRRCQADHQHEWHEHGHTNLANASPLCGRHNRLKHTGYTVRRDHHGYWHTQRPDGTELA